MLRWEFTVRHAASNTFSNCGNNYIINNVKDNALNRVLQETNSSMDGVTDDLPKI